MVHPQFPPEMIAAAARTLFSDKVYIVVTVAVAIAFWLLFNILDGLILLSPLNFYYPIPVDAIPGFVLSHVTATLVGIIVSMNIYMLRNLNPKASKTPILSGSTLGMVSSICAGCSSIGFYLVATFGTAGVVTSTFLSNYQLPLRLIAIGLLAWAYYSANKRITKTCAVT